MTRNDEELFGVVGDAVQAIFQYGIEELESNQPDIPSKTIFVPDEIRSVSYSQEEYGAEYLRELSLDKYIGEREIIDYTSYLSENIPYDLEELNRAAEFLSSSNIYEIYDRHPGYRGLDLAEEGKYEDSYKEYIDKRDDIDEDDFYISDIIDVSIRIAESQNSLNFDREYFTESFQRIIKEWRGDPREFSIYCPIINLIGDFECVGLPTDFDFKGDVGRVEINNSRIIRKSTEHLAGIYNISGMRYLPHIPDRFEQRWTHLLKLDLLGLPNLTFFRQYIKALGRCFRLKHPDSEIVYMGPAYHAELSKYLGKYEYPVIQGLSPPELSISQVYTSKTYGLTISEFTGLQSGDVEDMSNFIDRFLNQLNAERDSQISGTLRRYDKMFSDLYLEDRLVHCAIGFEGSLLRDIDTASSFTHRLKLRSGPLLQNTDISRDMIHDFFKSLYYVRGEIVHQDRDILDIIDNVGFQPPQNPDLYSHIRSGSPMRIPIDYFVFSRRMLAETILQYLDFDIDFGLTVTEVNRIIDDIMLDTSVDKEQFEGKTK